MPLRFAELLNLWLINGFGGNHVHLLCYIVECQCFPAAHIIYVCVDVCVRCSKCEQTRCFVVQCYDVLYLAVKVTRSAQHSSAHHRQPAQHSQHNTIQHSWATLVHLHTPHSNNNHSSDSTTQYSTSQNSTPSIHRQAHVAAHCHGTNQSQSHCATGEVGVNLLQNSFAASGVGINKLRNRFATNAVFMQQCTFVIHIIDSDLTDCKTVLQRIDPDPAGCKMDLGLIGSMAMCSHKLSSFAYTHPAHLHLHTPIHKSIPLIRQEPQETSHSRSLLEMWAI